MTQLAQQWERVLDGLGARLASLIEVNRAQPVSADGRGIVDVHRMPTTLVQLAESLTLEDLDIAVLLIASAISLDPRFEAYYVALNNDVNAHGPTVSTALRLSGHSMLEASARRRLRPDAPLRTLGLIDVGPTSRALPTQVITVPERVIGHLLGDSMLEAALARARVIPDRDPLDAEFLPEPPATGDYPVVLRARAGTAALGPRVGNR